MATFKTPSKQLACWIKSMGYEDVEAIGITNNLIKKLLPYTRVYNIQIENLLGRILKNTACLSLEKFKLIANYEIEKLKKQKTI